MVFSFMSLLLSSQPRVLTSHRLKLDMEMHGFVQHALLQLLASRYSLHIGSELRCGNGRWRLYGETQINLKSILPVHIAHCPFGAKAMRAEPRGSVSLLSDKCRSKHELNGS